MLFKQCLPTSSSSSFTKNKKLLSKSYLCKVCGDRAHGINYGAIACPSCKVFFRRNGFRPETAYPCNLSGQCEVNISRRRWCTSCRFAKCLAVGMSPDLIRKEDLHRTQAPSIIKSKKTRASKFKSVSQLPTLNLLHNDKSLLTTSQWILLSNVFHAYDRFNPISTYNGILKNLSISPYETRLDAADILKTTSSAFTSLQSFISSTPDFQVLSLNEQQSLLKRNLLGMGPFAASLAFRDTNFFQNSKCYNAFLGFYGSETTMQVGHLMNQLDLDSALLRFIILVISFSSNCFIVDIHENIHNDSFLFGTFRLFGSQNVYVEVLWKYMLYRYGYYETVLRFTGLIKCALDKIKQTSNLYMSNKIHKNLVDGIVKYSIESLIISRNEPVSLWGKTFLSN